MRKKRREKIVAVMLAISLLLGSSGTSVQANFADDWMGQTSSTNAGYYGGASRGFMTGGSFSARWPQGSDNLMTISKPSIKSGCGGIDMFLGGFSFLDTDKLVEKFQRILSAAPAAAFDIALKTLSPQVADTIKSLEALIQKLNNMQLDDCKAAKALVSVPMSHMGGLLSPEGKKALAAETSSAITDFRVSSGIDQEWKQTTDSLTSNFDKMFSGSEAEKAAAAGTITAQVAATTANCPPLLVDLLGSEGSVLSKLGARRGLPVEHVDQLKGYIGDVVISVAEGKPTALYQKPCPGVTYDSMMNGTAKKMTGNTYTAKEETYCISPGGSPIGLEERTSTAIKNSLAALRSKSGLAPGNPDLDLIKSIPMPILETLAVGVRSGTADIVVTQLSSVAANALTFMLIKDMIDMFYQANAEYRKILANQQPVGTDSKSCNASMYTEPTLVMQQLIAAADEKKQEAYSAYNRKAMEGAAISNLMAGLEKFRTETKKILGEQFGAAVARRSTGA